MQIKSRNHAGFSLVEALLAASFLSLISYSAVSMIKHLTNASKVTEKIQEKNAIQDVVRSYLQNPQILLRSVTSSSMFGANNCSGIIFENPLVQLDVKPDCGEMSKYFAACFWGNGDNDVSNTVTPCIYTNQNEFYPLPLKKLGDLSGSSTGWFHKGIQSDGTLVNKQVDSAPILFNVNGNECQNASEPGCFYKVSTAFRAYCPRDPSGKRYTSCKKAESFNLYYFIEPANKNIKKTSQNMLPDADKILTNIYTNSEMITIDAKEIWGKVNQLCAHSAVSNNAANPVGQIMMGYLPDGTIDCRYPDDVCPVGYVTEGSIDNPNADIRDTDGKVDGEDPLASVRDSKLDAKGTSKDAIFVSGKRKCVRSMQKETLKSCDTARGQMMVGVKADGTPICEYFMQVDKPNQTCSPPKVLKEVVNGNVVCESPKISCPAGYSVEGMNPDGSPICKFPLEGAQCDADSVLMGRYDSTTDLNKLNSSDNNTYYRSFTKDKKGNIIYGDEVCSKLKPKNLTCNPPGIVTGFDANGNVQCEPFKNNKSCPSQQVAIGNSVDGSLLCGKVSLHTYTKSQSVNATFGDMVAAITKDQRDKQMAYWSPLTLIPKPVCNPGDFMTGQNVEYSHSGYLLDSIFTATLIISCVHFGVY